jgi:hypothetical protein
MAAAWKHLALFTELPRRVLLGKWASGATKRNGEEKPLICREIRSAPGRTRTCDLLCS